MRRQMRCTLNDTSENHSGKGNKSRKKEKKELSIDCNIIMGPISIWLFEG